MLPHWGGRQAKDLRALLCELVTAELAHLDDPDVRWKGGNTRGADVVGVLKRDAKAVELKKGQVALTRWGATPFNPSKVDRIVLVHMELPEHGWLYTPMTGVAEVTCRARLIDVWDIPTADVNELMCDPKPVRDVLFEREWIEPYRRTHDLRVVNAGSDSIA